MPAPPPVPAECYAVADCASSSPAIGLWPLAWVSPLPNLAIGWRAFRFAAVSSPVAASAHRIAIPSGLAEAVPRRLGTFLAGRITAVQALRAAGYDAPWPIIGRDGSGAPQWPAGWIGSIAHTDGECVALGARCADVALLGVDCERLLDLEAAHDVVRQVAPECLKPNTPLVTDIPFATAVSLAFSAKEALFKALHPRVGMFFGFEAAECVAIDLEAGVLRLRLCESLPGGFESGQEFTLRFTLAADCVVTALAVPSSMPGHVGAR